MTPEEIKKERIELYNTIEVSNKRLEEIRKICAHEKTFKGLYSWRVGSYAMSLICEYCGECVKFNVGDDGEELEYAPKINTI